MLSLSYLDSLPVKRNAALNVHRQKKIFLSPQMLNSMQRFIKVSTWFPNALKQHILTHSLRATSKRERLQRFLDQLRESSLSLKSKLNAGRVSRSYGTGLVPVSSRDSWGGFGGFSDDTSPYDEFSEVGDETGGGGVKSGFGGYQTPPKEGNDIICVEPRSKKMERRLIKRGWGSFGAFKVRPFIHYYIILLQGNLGVGQCYRKSTSTS